MNPDFQSFFSDKLKEKGLSLKKLSEISGIALKHLENLNSGNLDALPPAPYIRGYLKKISEILEFDPEPWWQDLRREGEIVTSGNKDSLPQNRFAKKVANRKNWPIILIILIILAYFGFRSSKIFGRPEITTTYPPSEEVLIIQTKDITLQGNLRGGDKVMINGEATPINQDGSWQKTISLDPGPNIIEIAAKKFLGQETKITRNIIYEPHPESQKTEMLNSQGSGVTSTIEN